MYYYTFVVTFKDQSKAEVGVHAKSVENARNCIYETYGMSIQDMYLEYTTSICECVVDYTQITKEEIL